MLWRTGERHRRQEPLTSDNIVIEIHCLDNLDSVLISLILSQNLYKFYMIDMITISPMSAVSTRQSLNSDLRRMVKNHLCELI